MKKAALVLSGGGALGIAHVGALEVLVEKYKFDWYAGVSAGSIIASMLATGHTPKQIDTIFRKTNLFKLMFDLRPTQFGFMSGGGIEKTLEEIFEDKRIEDLDVPLTIGATDFATGERISIDSGLITEAVRASISVPVMFEPVWHKEHELWLVDGGLSQNFPLDLAIEEYQGHHIIGIDVGSSIDQNIDFAEKSFWKRGENLSHSLVRAIRIMFKNQQQVLPDHRTHILEPELGKYHATDVVKYSKIKNEGRKVAREFLKA